MIKEIYNKLFNKLILFIVLVILSISSILFTYNILKFDGNIAYDGSGIIPKITLYLNHYSSEVFEFSSDFTKPITIVNNTNNNVELFVNGVTPEDSDSSTNSGYVVGGVNSTFLDNKLELNSRCENCTNLNTIRIYVYMESENNYNMNVGIIAPNSQIDLNLLNIDAQAQNSIDEQDKLCMNLDGNVSTDVEVSCSKDENGNWYSTNNYYQLYLGE